MSLIKKIKQNKQKDREGQLRCQHCLRYGYLDSTLAFKYHKHCFTRTVDPRRVFCFRCPYTTATALARQIVKLLVLGRHRHDIIDWAEAARVPILFYFDIYREYDLRLWGSSDQIVKYIILPGFENNRIFPYLNNRRKAEEKLGRIQRIKKSEVQGLYRTSIRNREYAELVNSEQLTVHNYTP